MDVYTLDRNFLKKEVVDGFRSCIWTERYSRYGDVQLTVPAEPDYIQTLAKGTCLSIPDSDEIMLIETHDIRDSLLTATGNSLTGFFDHRAFRQAEYHWLTSYKFTAQSPSSVIQLCVQFAAGKQTPTGVNESQMNDYGLDGPREVLTGLDPDDVLNFDTTGTRIDLDVPVGMLGTVISRIAEDYQVGFRLYLLSATDAGYRLGFRVYAGRDLTSGQSLNPLVRFSPDLGNLTDIRELNSIARYANVAYAYAPNMPDRLVWATPRADDPLFIRLGEAYIDGGDTAVDFNRRVIMATIDDFDIANFQRTDLNTTKANILPFLDRRARDILANNLIISMVDGEIVPESEFKFGRDYTLGDIVELQGYSGDLQRARVTEYIRSDDDTGERAYPTITIVD